MTDSNATLLPCPFCGGEARLIGVDVGWMQPACMNPECGCDWTDFYAIKDEAIEAWNTRTPEQAVAATLEADEWSLPEPDGWYKCPECGCVVGYTELYGGGWSIMMDDYQIPFNNCPNCGKAVKR